MNKQTRDTHISELSCFSVLYLNNMIKKNIENQKNVVALSEQSDSSEKKSFTIQSA